MGGESYVRILRQSHVLCYHMFNHHHHEDYCMWEANGHILGSICCEVRSGVLGVLVPRSRADVTGPNPDDTGLN